MHPEPVRKYFAERMRKRYFRLKATGLCVLCGDMPPAEGKVKCVSCLVVKSKQATTRRQQKKVATVGS